VHYLHRGVPRERLLAYYRLADTMLVTPLKDGMNLVAKEYVVCQHATGGTGALVLSEFTGSTCSCASPCSTIPSTSGARPGASPRRSPWTATSVAVGSGAMTRRIVRDDVFRWLGRNSTSSSARTSRCPNGGRTHLTGPSRHGRLAM
jgi:trehalose 6-phosphate synthase